MPELILLRHGQLLCDLKNRFTAEIDIHLSVQGEKEPKNAGNYGKLQRLNKAEKVYRVEKVQLYWKNCMKRLPGSESLDDPFCRLVPYYLKDLRPQLNKVKIVLIVAHWNSLRSLIM